MKGRILALAVLGALLLAVLLASRAKPTAAATEKDTDVFASPVNGGCYIAAANDCRLHIDPYTVNIGSGNQLEAVRVQANGVTVYDYKTDVSNPPSGNTYTLSVVAQDFAAQCGTSYVINVLGKNKQDPNFLNMGQTTSFTCPASVP